MPKVDLNGVGIYYEETGEGFPLVFAHELAGNTESWKAQVSYFSRRYRVITYNARGYPPSEVPTDGSVYTEDNAVDDMKGVLDALGIAEAHIAGLSMGGTLALNFGIKYPHMAKSLVVAAAGTGSNDPAAFRRTVTEFARRMEEGGMEALREYARGPARVQLMRKDPKGWREFSDQLAEHSPMGSALTFRGVQGGRPPVFALEEQMKALQVPTLIMLVLVGGMLVLSQGSVLAPFIYTLF